MNNTFQNIIIENFDEIQRNFKSGLKNNGYSYNEDLMNDTFISCCQTLGDKSLTKKEAIKYYWVSYLNKYKTYKTKTNRFVELDDNDYEDPEDEYDESIDKIYDIIMNAIRDEFGIRDAYIWELYVCKGISSKKIRQMGFNHIDNFVYFKRKIKRYILHHVIPDNPELQELIKYRKEL